LRVAALYDVHGNLPALEAVLEEVAREDVDLIVVGGDLPGPWTWECLARLRAAWPPLRFIRGNGERELEEAEPDATLAWVLSRMPDEQRAFFVALPLTETADVDGLGPVLFCHATPSDDAQIFTTLTPDEAVQELVGNPAEPTVVCGHTHIQFDRTVGGTRIVNAGSVGMPYEDEPGAYWALLGPGVQLRRTEYDVDAMLVALAEAGYPGEWPQASREEATEFFESRR
jgi:predicted phosphodiesterase